ncbi:MAG: TolC family protein [Verrucomicrobiota bacterium]
MRKLINSLLVMLVWTLPVAAQSNPQTVRSIAMQECIEMALKHNFDLKIERFNPKIALDAVQSAEGLYDPTLSVASGRNYANSVVTGQKNYTDSLSASLSGQGPYGLQYALPLNFTSGGFGHGLDTQGYTGSGGLSVVQPILKGALIDGPRYSLLVSRKTLKMSEYALRFQLQTVITSVRVAYYDLVFARESVKVQEKALELAERLQADNKAKVKAGTLPPLDEKQAESQVATTRADLLAAKQALTSQENLLKNLIVDDLTTWHKLTLTPAEQLVAAPASFDVSESWKTGLATRPDLAQMRIDLERYDLDIQFYKNQTLPDLSFVGRYGLAASGRHESSIETGLREGDHPYYYYGMQLNIPLFNRKAKSDYRKSKDQRAQAELRVQQAEQVVLVTIDNAISLARSSFDSVAATRQAREYAELALEAEQKKLENGKSTSFFVLQFQRDLTRARSEEIRALADYNKALARVAQAEGTAMEKAGVNIQVK